MKWVQSKNANNDNNEKLFKQLIIQVGKAQGHRRHEDEKVWRACTDCNLRGAGKHKLLTIKIEVEIFTCYNPYWSPRKIQNFPPNFLVRKPSVNRQFVLIFGYIIAETVHLRKVSSEGNQVEKLVFYVVGKNLVSSAITW